MEKPIYYLAHDPLSNTEAMLTDYDAELVSKAAASGIVFIAVDASGNREIVNPEEVSEPEDDSRDFTIVQPQYVDERAQATVAVFDALQSMLMPSVAAIAEDGVDAKTPAETFEEALSALRNLAYPEE